MKNQESLTEGIRLELKHCPPDVHPLEFLSAWRRGYHSGQSRGAAAVNTIAHCPELKIQAMKEKYPDLEGGKGFANP